MAEKPKYIDIHTHVNFVAFDEDREDVIGRTLNADTWMINVGTQTDTSKRAVDLANKYTEGVYAIVGLHPIHTSAIHRDSQEVGGSGFNSRAEDFEENYYLDLAKNPKVVGIGETGLDYFHLDESNIENQKKIFEKEIELANKINKPLMLHIRSGEKDAYEDALEILEDNSKVRCNAHFFAGTKKQAQRFLDLGGTVSFTGVITFAKDYRELVEYVPLDKMMAETDAPYVAPALYRGKRNEPLYVKEVVKEIASIKKLPEDEVREQLVENAFDFFRLTKVA